MAIPKGLVSVARGSGVARKLLDIAAELKLEPQVVRTTTNYGYLVPEKVAEKYEADLAKGTKAKGAQKTAAQKKAEAKAKAEAEEKAKADAEAEENAKAEADAKAKADEEAAAKAAKDKE